MTAEKSLTGLQKARQLAEQLGDDLFKYQNNDIDDLEVDIDVEKVYSLEELLDFFKPIPHYERQLLHHTTRSSGSSRRKSLPLVQPKNGMDCSSYLPIQLNEPVDCPLQINIYNSDDEVILETTKELSGASFSIDIAHLSPGRYYVKVRAENYIMQLRSFFVNKHWMPKN